MWKLEYETAGGTNVRLYAEFSCFGEVSQELDRLMEEGCARASADDCRGNRFARATSEGATSADVAAAWNACAALRVAPRGSWPEILGGLSERRLSAVHERLGMLPDVSVDLLLAVAGEYADRVLTPMAG